MTQDGVVRQTTAYERIEGFAEYFGHAIRTVLAAAEHTPCACHPGGRVLHVDPHAVQRGRDNAPARILRER